MGGSGALPLWSTAEIAAAITIAVRRHDVREIVFLGDAIHGSGMSEGAARAVRGVLDTLRALATVTVIAGNHEGRSRGVAILGTTVERAVRDGWSLEHGDKPVLRQAQHDNDGAQHDNDGAQHDSDGAQHDNDGAQHDNDGARHDNGARTIIGHLHPSLRLGGDRSAPAFLAGRELIVVPALTPYSPGLDVLSDACLRAVSPWNVTRRDLHVVAATNERVFPFGTLSALRGELRRPAPANATGFKRRRALRADR